MTQAPEVQAHLDLRGILDADQHRRRLASKLRRRQAKSAAPLLRLADRKSTRLNSSHSQISYAVFCLKKKKASRSRINVRRNTWIHLSLGKMRDFSLPPSSAYLARSCCSLVTTGLYPITCTVRVYTQA